MAAFATETRAKHFSSVGEADADSAESAGGKLANLGAVTFNGLR